MVVKRDQLNASKRTVKTNQSGLTKMRASSGVFAPRGFKPTTESVREKLSGATVKTNHVGNTGSLKSTSAGLEKMRTSSGLVASKRFKTNDNDWIKLGITNQVSASDSKSFSTVGRAVDATEKLKFSEAKQVKVRSQQSSNPVKQELSKEKSSVMLSKKQMDSPIQEINKGKVREKFKPQIKGRRGK